MLPQWTLGIHHDGSALYVSNGLPTLNEPVELTLRAPLGAPITGAFIRTALDGEQSFLPMSETRTDETSRYYSAKLIMRNRRMTYRFKLITAEGSFYVNAQGVSRADQLDFYDFKLLADFESPAWLADAVFYQIFPDRFYNGDPANLPPVGKPVAHPPHGEFETQHRTWDEKPLPFSQGGSVDFFGGDLLGIQQKLAHLQALGVNAIYLNPIFTSPTNHKYNIEDFFSVDPHFGGNAALIALREALTAAQMRIVLDITPNHCGDTSDWFKAAQADPHADVAEFFTFYEHPHDYEAWFNIKTLPKLNYTSQKLRDVMYRSAESVMKFWLKPPYRIDGWRLDVWNMTARQGSVDLWHDVGREMRTAVKSVDPDAYLFGENFFDGSASLQGDELDAVMNYQGFSFPVWRWLAGHDLGAWHGTPQAYTDRVPLPAEAATEQMRNYLASIPWAVARLQFNQLGSHDTPRILDVVKGNRALVRVANVLLFTFPGVPCVYYGDEIGMAGWADPDNRRPMIWDESRWDSDLFAQHQALIALRKSAHALIHGGLQFLHTEGDVLAYQRHSSAERLLVVAHKGASPAPVVLEVWHGGIADGTRFVDLLGGAEFRVQGGKLDLGTVAEASALILQAQA